ncbi:chromosome segregation protein SMC [Haloechinothrix sp. LS1_15]|uniref:chromosome segregation protein SMC n=1 Tax=Haloechinothrix sp. LS1_15 TaxID=2652248 RepID=UPI002946F799|nr:chromosome segregation protein SMC [Haloechinothrix sp. LS1_15]MDV6012847.1 chromosome segregation protein SMC [Haloechinothrix sp. LS1_15]
MHLKSLTLKGFKSFASATTLRFEPGITCVVGPNGSGKSNVLDALRWVMGTQGAKDLRGGKMEDVIFAGTSGRAPLGRAEVTLTIDNSDGALPIEYTEVSITRRMFRDGASEYEINGSTCRLMDVQELLSDSGIGREMHVIVGQGQLSEILHAKPEDRRAFIEEAAGVLKHRKRKEKAQRKLNGMQANLDRLNDLTSELRKQLKPLGKQAEAARKAQTVQAELRDARLRLHADDLVSQREALAKEEADEQAARARKREVEQALEAATAEQTELEESLAADAPKLAEAQDTWYKLSSLAERLRGTVRLAVERQRHLSAEVHEHVGDRDPEELLAEAEEAAAQEQELTEAVEQARQVLTDTIERREQTERLAREAEERHMAAVRAIADRREGVAKLRGEVDALRSKDAATEEELERLTNGINEAAERAEQAAEELEQARTEGGISDEGDADLDSRYEQAVQARDVASARVAELADAERAAERDIASERARVDALSMGQDRKDGSAALLHAGDGEVPGLLGAVAEQLEVRQGYEVAVAAALGPIAEAVAMRGPAEAVAAIEYLKTHETGRAAMLLGGTDGSGAAGATARPPLPESGRWASDLVTPPEAVRGAVERLLDRVVVVDDLAAARRLVDARPELRAVTMQGDVLGTDCAFGGASASASAIEVQAAVEDAQQRLAEAEQRLGETQALLDGARAELRAREGDVTAAKEAQSESKVRKARTTERIERLEQAARSAEADVERLRKQRAQVYESREQALAKLAELEERLGAISDEPVDEDPDTSERDNAAASLSEMRQAEVDARLTLRTAEERVEGVAGRAESLRQAAEAERQARERAEKARIERQRAAGVAEAVVSGGEVALERIEVSLRRAAEERDAVQRARQQREDALAQVRTRVRQLTGELEKLTDAVHRDELVRAEQRTRLEQLENKIVEEFGIGLEELVAEYGPDQPVPAGAEEMAEYEAARERGEDVSEPQPMPYDRATQERRAKRAEKDLASLGKVNPLALEEYAALEERYKFLSTQLEDLQNTRKDLLSVISEVDEKILELFSTAYQDVAREFETVFAALFPGGEGRLILTEPDDPLATGVDVEARPPGKKVKRLSLLSGGEKSLVAVAMLIAIFRARPSPFYVLDEVEAALDETNMRRLLNLLEQLKESSQLIVITHQKPTMEIADALYGVSMAGDGITQVISQRLRAGVPEPISS